MCGNSQSTTAAFKRQQDAAKNAQNENKGSNTKGAQEDQARKEVKDQEKVEMQESKAANDKEKAKQEDPKLQVKDAASTSASASATKDPKKENEVATSTGNSEASDANATTAAATAAASSTTSSGPAIVAIVYYSLYGHVGALAKRMKEEIEKIGKEKVIVRIYQVKETLPDEVLKKMNAPEKDKDIPIINDGMELIDADGIIFGISSRYGMIPAQMKSFMDSTGNVWQKGGYVGKIASVFFSTSTVAGGQETSMKTMLPFITHHGMIYAPIGYTNNHLFNIQEIHGGSPWGSGTITGGDGQRFPSQIEFDIAAHQASMIANYAIAMKKGKQ